MSWYKQKGQGATQGVTDHAQLTDLEYDKSGHIGFQRQVSVWATGHQYMINDLVTKSGVLYRCVTSHMSTSLSADLANWECIGSAGGLGVVQRISKPNVTAPQVVDIPKGEMGMVQARIFVPGSEQTELVCDFNNTDAASFLINGQSGELSPYYAWDGTMQPVTVFQKTFSLPVDLEGGKTAESDWINPADYKSILSVSLQ